LSTAQEAGSGPNLAAAGEFPEAPQPQFAFAWAEPAEAQTHSGRNQGAPPTSAPVQNGNLQTGTQNSSSAQTAATQSDTEKSEHEKAEEQLKEQEHQRVAGVMATFNTTSNRNALPLSRGRSFSFSSGVKSIRGPSCWQAPFPASARPTTATRSGDRALKGTRSDLARPTPTLLSAISLAMQCCRSCSTKIRGTSRKARAAKRDDFYGRRRARSGAGATKVDGGRTMPMSEAT